jgi:hypothetical protein
MEVFVYKDRYINMFSDGIEDKYKGKSIIYNNLTKTFIYYYYKNHKKLYIIDGKREETQLANVIEKVRIIGVLRNREVANFTKYLKMLIKNKKIFYMEDDFFIDITIIIKKRPKMSDIMQVFEKYKREQGSEDGQ